MPKAIQTGLTQNRSFLFPDVDARAMVTAGALITLAGQSAPRTYTLPDADCGVLTDHAVITVAQGGSGASSFTAHGVLLGNSSGAFGVTAVGADGTVMVGHTGADPSFSASPTLASVIAPLYTAGSGADIALRTTGAANVFLGANGSNLFVVENGTLSFSPTADNARDLGIPGTNRYHAGYFATAVVVGTNPSSTGELRFSSGSRIIARNNSNSADLLMLSSDSTDTLFLGNGYNKFQVGGGATFIGIGGITSSFPAIARNGTQIQFVLGDSSGFADTLARIIGAAAFTGPGTTALTGDWRAQSGFTFKARNNANGADGTILSTDAQDKAVLSGHFTSVANNGVISLGATTLGLLTVVTDGGATALFSVTGGSHTVLLISDPGPAFSVAAGTAGRANVYWSAVNSRYELENKLGSTLAFAATLIGKN